MALSAMSLSSIPPLALSALPSAPPSPRACALPSTAPAAPASFSVAREQPTSQEPQSVELPSQANNELLAAVLMSTPSAALD